MRVIISERVEEGTNPLPRGACEAEFAYQRAQMLKRENAAPMSEWGAAREAVSCPPPPSERVKRELVADLHPPEVIRRVIGNAANSGS